MAGIQVAPGSHSQVLGSGSAAGQTLVYTGASGQVNHEVEEVEIILLAVTLHHLSRQLIVLLADKGDILLADSVILLRRRYNRLYGHLLKP